MSTLLAMTQLTLSLTAVAPPGFGNFVAGRNIECLQTLAGLLDAMSHGRMPQPRICYIWGSPGTGKSHLARALSGRAGAVAWTPDGIPADAVLLHRRGDVLDGPRLDVVDDVQALTPAAQHALVDRFHELQQDPLRAIVAFGTHLPAQLVLIPELSSRLSWGLTFVLEPLDEDDTRRVVRLLLDERGIDADDTLLDRLMQRSQRDIRSLKRVIERLDALSLEHKRPIDQALLRQAMSTLAPVAAAPAHAGDPP